MYAINTLSWAVIEDSIEMLLKLVLHKDIESGIVIIQETLPEGQKWKVIDHQVVSMSPEEIASAELLAMRKQIVESLKWHEDPTARSIRVIVRQSDTEPPEGVLRELAIKMILRGSPHFRCDADGSQNALGEFHAVYLKRLDEAEKPQFIAYINAVQGDVLNIENLTLDYQFTKCTLIELT